MILSQGTVEINKSPNRSGRERQVRTVKIIRTRKYRKTDGDITVHINGFADKQEQEEIAREIHTLLIQRNRRKFKGHKLNYKIKIG